MIARQAPIKQKAIDGTDIINSSNLKEVKSMEVLSAGRLLIVVVSADEK